MLLAPTLAVYDPDKPGLTKSDQAKPDEARYRQSLRKFDFAMKNVKAMFDAGMPIGVGTDAGMPATPHGAATLHELELLVRAGLTPAQALVAATQTSAKIMRLDGDRGTIAVGKRADLLLIDGKPWENIADIHQIRQVYIDGRLVSGTGAPALLLSARMAMKTDAYAGFAVPLTRGSVVPVDLAGYKGIRFDIKGAGDYSLRLNGVDGVWSAPVSASGPWRQVEVPFSALVAASQRGKAGPAFSGDGIIQVELGGSRDAGQRLWLEVDNIRFY
jgi:hypothetical protein